MAQTIVALSGPWHPENPLLRNAYASGSVAAALALGKLLADRFGAEKTTERGALQALGEGLDKKTEGDWVAEDIAREVSELPSNALIVVDSVRIKGQIDALRKTFGRRVIHVHLDAPFEELQRRYGRRPKKITELPTYDDVRKDPTEAAVGDLEADADIVVDTSRQPQSPTSRFEQQVTSASGGVIPVD